MGTLLFPKKNWVDEEGVTLHTAADRWPIYPVNVLTTSKLPSENVQDRDLSQPFRVLTLGRARTFIELHLGEERACDVVAIAGTNLSPTAQIRVFTMQNGLNRFVERVQPTSVPGMINATGNATDIDDDPREPDSNNLAVTTDGLEASGRIAFDFNDPSGSQIDLKTGAGLQVFELLSGGGGDLEMQVYESGARVGTDSNTLPSTALVSEGGSLLELAWDAADLALVTGEDAEAYWLANNGGAGLVTNAPMAFAWFARLDTDDTDSGWQYVYPTGPRSDAYADWPFGRSAVVKLPASTTATQVRIEIYDPDNDVGYIDIGRVVVGEAIEPGFDSQLGTQSLGVVDSSRSQQLADGQEFFEQGARRRATAFTFGHLTRAEAEALTDYFDGRKGTTGEVGIITDASDANELGYRHAFGRLGSLLPAVLSFNDANREYWSKTIEHLELISQ